MNDVNFCHKLYDDIMKIYNDTFAYRVTTYEDNPFKAQIEYIPVGFNDLINHITALDSISSCVQFDLKESVFLLNIEVCTKETGECYLIIHVYSKLKTVCYDLSSKDWNLKTGNIQKKIFIFSEKDVYSMSNTNHRYYPTNLKDLSIFPKELISILVSRFNDTDTYILKDFITDNFFPPVRLNEICLYHNKKDYLEKTFKLSLPKSVNKLPLNQSYAVCCALKYIKPEQQQLIFTLKYDFDAKYKKYNITKRKRESIAANYLKSLLSARLVDINQSVLNDYIDFSLQLCKPVDILAGKKRIVKLHNEITDEIIEKSNKLSKITIPETPLKYLKLPKEFVLLKSQKALINEGRINHNCVGAYGQDIISGKCVIYSANIHNEHLTIEIKFIKIKNEYKFYVAQCYKACNIPCSPDILAYVRECLAKCSDKAIKKYIKAVKKMKHSPVRNGKEAK